MRAYGGVLCLILAVAVLAGWPAALDAAKKTAKSPKATKSSKSPKVKASSPPPKVVKSGEPDTLIVFGDSYSDTGMRWKVSGYTKPVKEYGYWNGRYSDFYNWVDAAQHNFSHFKVAKSYAVGGATTNLIGIDPLHDDYVVPKQIANFTKEKDTFSSNRIVVLFSGHNDGSQRASTMKNISNWPLFPDILDAIDEGNVATAEWLLQQGEKIVVVAQLMPLNKLPIPDSGFFQKLALGIAVDSINDDMETGLNKLRKKYPDRKLLLWKTNDFMNFLLDHLKEFKLKDDACVKYTGSMAFPGNVSLLAPVCTNPKEYVFFDNVHISSTTNYLLAFSLMELLKKEGVFKEIGDIQY